MAEFYIKTIEDFINTYIHVVSQMSKIWLPPVGTRQYLDSWYNYLKVFSDTERNSSSFLDLVILPDLDKKTKTLLSIRLDDLTTNFRLESVRYLLFFKEDQDQNDFFKAVEDIWNYIKELCPIYFRWLDIHLEINKNIKKTSKNMFNHLYALSKHSGYEIPYSSPYYPKLLRHIEDPPSSISVLGNLANLNQPTLSIVGARKASSEALEESFKLSRLLSRSGVVVVSGGAIGCDIAAHLGSLNLSKQSSTVVVLAGGLGKLYPRTHQKYFKKILSLGGTLMSEKPWYHECKRSDFPVRNRLICGLSSGVVLIQGNKKSGSSVTASLAINQGRDLYVLLRKGQGYLGNMKFFQEGAIGYYGYKDFIDKKFYRYKGSS